MIATCHLRRERVNIEEGNVFVCADIHGQLDRFWEAMNSEGVSPENGDVVICVGDLIDRGEKNKECAFLLENCWFHSALGNHELMFLDAYEKGFEGAAHHEWLQDGGGWNVKCTAEEINRIAKLFSILPHTIDVKRKDGSTIGIVHAQYELEKWSALEERDFEQPLIDSMMRGRSVFKNFDLGVTHDIYATIHGHTILKHAPQKIGNSIFLDGGAAVGERINFINVNELNLDDIPVLKLAKRTSTNVYIKPLIDLFE